MVELGKWVADKAKGCFVRWRDRKGKALLEKIKRGELTGIELRQRRIEEEREQARKIERGEFDPNDLRVMMPLSMTKKDFELIIETLREHDDNNVEALKKICKIVKKKKAKEQEVLA
jgi:hypothetical protein